MKIFLLLFLIGILPLFSFKQIDCSTHSHPHTIILDSTYVSSEVTQILDVYKLTDGHYSDITKSFRVGKIIITYRNSIVDIVNNTSFPMQQPLIKIIKNDGRVITLNPLCAVTSDPLPAEGNSIRYTLTLTFEKHYHFYKHKPYDKYLVLSGNLEGTTKSPYLTNFIESIVIVSQ